MTISVSDTVKDYSQSPVTPVSRDHDGQSLRGLETIPEQATAELVLLFKSLADETRLRILLLLQQRDELNVRTLCRLLQQSQPAVSHHLALLRSDGLIAMRRDGKHNYYRLSPKRFAELIGRLFAVSPNAENQIRFDDYVLSYREV